MLDSSMDPIVLLQATAVAALVAAVAVLFAGWPWRAPRSARSAAGCVLGVGLGFFAGWWWLGVLPKWPPLEDQDRLLLILFPALVVIELLATIPGPFRRLTWPLRLVICAGAGRLLLDQTTFITDLNVAGTPEWTPAQTWLILGGMAASLAVVWGALATLTHRPPLATAGEDSSCAGASSAATRQGWRAPGRSVPLALALACAGAGVTVMLSGYATGGQLGLPLAASLAGALAASLVLAEPPEMKGIVGLGVVGLFALVVVGRYFGNLSTTNAVLLFFGPLLCWLPELPQRFHGLARVAWAAVPVAIAVLLAQPKFVEDSNRSSSGTKESMQTAPGTPEPSREDYLNFRK
jgi:hypothetical protein